jgi:hypothetical protein
MTITLDDLNINDGTIYTVLNENVNLGQPQTTWDEVRSYAGGGDVQVNLHIKKALIPTAIPMLVKGTSLSDLNTNIEVLLLKVDSCTTGSPKTLVWGSESFSIVYSSRPAEIIRDPQYQLGFRARFVLVLMRTP